MINVIANHIVLFLVKNQNKIVFENFHFAFAFQITCIVGLRVELISDFHIT